MPVKEFQHKNQAVHVIQNIISISQYEILLEEDQECFPNQKDAALQMANHILCNNKKRITLIAMPQTGKTGTIKAFAQPFVKKGIVVIVISGMSNTELKEQLKRDLGISNVYMNQDLQQLLKKIKELLKKNFKIVY